MALVRLRNSNGGGQGKLRATTDPNYESRIEAAREGIVAGRYKSISVAAHQRESTHNNFSQLHYANLSSSSSVNNHHPTSTYFAIDSNNHYHHYFPNH